MFFLSTDRSPGQPEVFNLESVLRQHEGAFKALILAENWANFQPSPEELYTIDIRVRVHGPISWYQGDSVIFVRSPEQIEVLDQPGQP
jgi:hypothetical protein